MSKNIVIVDDDREMCALLNEHLTAQGYHATEFTNPIEAVAAISEKRVEADMLITDLNMPRMNGLELTKKIKSINEDMPVLLITAFGTIENAVLAMQAGAFDYVIKPFKLDEISLKVGRALQVRELKSQNRMLRDAVNGVRSFKGIIGKSNEMLEVYDLIKRVSQATANIMISGESGTGKEQVARAIHQSGPRASHAFVAINCTAIPEALMESELFGHAKGSFTGA